MATIFEDAILTHLAICPMAADEVAEDLKLNPDVTKVALDDLARRGAVKRKWSARIEGGGLLYSLPGYREASQFDFAHLRTARDYGAIYSDGYGDGDG